MPAFASMVEAVEEVERVEQRAEIFEEILTDLLRCWDESDAKVAAIPRDRWEAEFAKEFTRAFLLRNIMERAVIADRKTRKER